MSSDRENELGLVPALELPDDRGEWAAWLEKQVVGLNLLKLVKQWIVLGANHPPKLSLAEVLGERRQAVLSSGLQQNLDTAKVVQLVQNPALLLELQDAVLLEGGEYWEQLPRTQAHQDLAEATRRAVLARIQGDQASQTNRGTDRLAGSSSVDAPVALPKPTKDAQDKTLGVGWIASLAALAAVLLFGIFFPWVRPSNQLFFAAVELQAKAKTPQESLERMAERVRRDWKTGLEAAALKTQLVAFRDSCDQLIAGPLVETLEGLPATVIADVQERCRLWKGQATDLITALDSGTATDQTHRDADALIEKLTNKLREIAASS